MAADFGEWVIRTAKKKDNAIFLVIISIISPIGFVIAASLIANIYKKGKKK